MLEETKKKIEEIVSSAVTDASLELVDVRFKYLGRTTAIDILVDHLKGGITIAECTLINRNVSQTIETQNIFPDGNFEVEVSSPGLDRPLKTVRDFVRSKGKMVHFYLSERINDRLEHEGTVFEVGQEKVTVKVNAENILITLTIINKAVLVLN